MRYLLLADIHGNADALEAVLGDAQKRDFGQTIFLGDAVGYGADAGAVLKLLQELKPRCIQGNHDAMLLELAKGKRIKVDSPVGMSLRHNISQLLPSHIGWMQTWVTEAALRLDGAGVTFAHGSPRDPKEYVDTVNVARAVFAGWSGKLAFVGHSHLAGVFACLENNTEVTFFHACLENENRLPMPPRGRWIVNPGSVGQPRDGNPKASYGIFDTSSKILEVYRVAYDIAAAQKKIRAAGLPEALASRLDVGR
jgi:diadenosine tetraphosphatase ApaH/serine/threonine PP2A family protein phosphatase